MSDTNSLNPTMTELFSDAAREIIERNRIRSQMSRILKIVKADTLRLNNAYAEIGKMYLDGTLDKSSPRVGVLLKNIEHLKLRIERANIRYEQLKEAHSVDECTQAFKDELTAKVKKAQEATAEFAKGVSEKAKSAAGDLSEKAKAAADDFSNKARSVAGVTINKAKSAADDLSKKAQELKGKVTKKSTPDELFDEPEEAADEVTDSILDSIADTLQSIDEPIEETPDTDGESADSFTF